MEKSNTGRKKCKNPFCIYTVAINIQENGYCAFCDESELYSEAGEVFASAAGIYYTEYLEGGIYDYHASNEISIDLKDAPVYFYMKPQNAIEKQELADALDLFRKSKHGREVFCAEVRAEIMERKTKKQVTRSNLTVGNVTARYLDGEIAVCVDYTWSNDPYSPKYWSEDCIAVYKGGTDLTYVGLEDDLIGVDENADDYTAPNGKVYEDGEISAEVELELFEDEVCFLLKHDKSEVQKRELSVCVDDFITHAGRLVEPLRAAVLQDMLPRQNEQALKVNSSVRLLWEMVDIFDQLSACYVDGIGACICLEYSSHLDDWAEHVAVFKGGKELIYAGVEKEVGNLAGRSAIEAAAPAPEIETLEVLEGFEKAVLLTFQRSDPDTEFESQAIKIPMLFGEKCVFELEECFEDIEDQGVYFEAIENMLEASVDVLKSVEGELYAYYEDTIKLKGLTAGDYEEIASADEVWEHIDLGEVLVVGRDVGVGYISIECGCSWEEEHGLQIVIREGREVCKVGPYDGHYENAVEGVIYERVG